MAKAVITDLPVVTWKQEELEYDMGCYAKDSEYAALFSKHNPTPGAHLHMAQR
jgi:hypothetical protein